MGRLRNNKLSLKLCKSIVIIGSEPTQLNNTLPILFLVKLLKYLNRNKLEPTDTYPLLSHTTQTHPSRVLRDIIKWTKL